MQGSCLGVVKGGTRSLDYGSYRVIWGYIGYCIRLYRGYMEMLSPKKGESNGKEIGKLHGNGVYRH